jgi:hypothetical protein
MRDDLAITKKYMKPLSLIILFMIGGFTIFYGLVTMEEPWRSIFLIAGATLLGTSVGTSFGMLIGERSKNNVLGILNTHLATMNAIDSKISSLPGLLDMHAAATKAIDSKIVALPGLLNLGLDLNKTFDEKMLFKYLHRCAPVKNDLFVEKFSKSTNLLIKYLREHYLDEYRNAIEACHASGYRSLPLPDHVRKPAAIEAAKKVKKSIRAVSLAGHDKFMDADYVEEFVKLKIEDRNLDIRRIFVLGDKNEITNFKTEHENIIEMHDENEIKKMFLTLAEISDYHRGNRKLTNLLVVDECVMTRSLGDGDFDGEISTNEVDIRREIAEFDKIWAKYDKATHQKNHRH